MIFGSVDSVHAWGTSPARAASLLASMLYRDQRNRAYAASGEERERLLETAAETSQLAKWTDLVCTMQRAGRYR